MRQRRMGNHAGNILPLHGGGSTLSESRRRKRRSKQNKRCLLTLGISVTIMGVIVLVFVRLNPSKQGAITAESNHHSDPLRKIRCDDGNTVVGLINDDYCDCPDGSDEKLTSACSNILVQKGTFHCRDNSSIVLFPSRLHDGVKDCTDGSDED